MSMQLVVVGVGIAFPSNAERDGEINLANLPNCILRLCAGDRETEREKERARRNGGTGK